MPEFKKKLDDLNKKAKVLNLLGILSIITVNDFDTLDTLDTLTFPTELIKYLDMLNKNLSNNFAIISTPGIDKGFDFTGSGSYIIKNDCIKSH